MQTGMYLYPWDIGSDLDSFYREYERTGCNAVAPALSYHHGNIFSARSGAVYSLDEAAVSFSPDIGMYGRLQPEVHRTVADAGVVSRLREWCGGTRRHFCGWTVILHNSTLGGRHPDVCVENALGARYRHALCPSHPDVREYGKALLLDICRAMHPDSLMLESATVPTAFHGGHHEIANVGITPAVRWLMSLCFCPHCLESAGNAGRADPHRARATCVALLKRLLNREVHIPGGESGQIATLLLEYPELHAYQSARQNGVTEFVRLLSETLRGRGVEFKLISSAIPHPVMSSYFEGLSFREVAGLADVLLPLVYGEGETYALVRENIRLLDPDTPVGMAMTLHPGRHPDKSNFLGAVAGAAANKPACVYFYNYSIASEERLGWVSEAVPLLRGAG